jgi:transposase-like protein
MDKAKTSKRYSTEVHSRAVRMVLEHGADHASQWAAIGSIAAKIGCTAETLRGWVRRAERDQRRRPGPTSDERRATTRFASRRWNARCENCARPTRSCARCRRILRWRSSTAGPSHDRLHRRSSRCLRGRADLPSCRSPQALTMPTRPSAPIWASCPPGRSAMPACKPT